MEQQSLLRDASAAPVLRPYQQRAVDRVFELMGSGVRAPLIVAPTGAGKTVLAAEIVRRHGGRILFLAPRRELIHQTCRKLDAVGVDYGVLLAGDRRVNLYAHVQVASVDTAIARLLRTQKITMMPFDLLIVDEAHVGLTETRQRLLNLWPDAKVVGLTATPCRSDGKALGQVYDELVEVASVAELTEQGFLVPGRYFSVSEPDLKRVRTTAGDYNLGDLEATMNKPKLVGDIVEHWMKHAGSRRTVVFATSIQHSAALAREFVMHGVSAEHVDANSPQAEREAIFERFQNGSTQVLTNCTLASIGFDLPELDCVVFARPTKSLGLYLQMLGRGLRPAPGKQDCLVLDHAGNVRRLGFATDDRFWTLHGKYAQDEAKLERSKKDREERDERDMECPECSMLWRGGRTCPGCGYTFPPKAKRLDVHEGSLVELSARAQDSEQTRKGFYWQLLSYGEMRGWKQAAAAFKYQERYGAFPPREWLNEYDRLGVQPQPSMETVRWVKSRQIAWAKSQQRRSA